MPPHDSGSGAGSLQSLQQLGAAFGIAIAGQIFFSSLTGSFATGAAPHPAFTEALAGALVYSICSFLVVALLVAFLTPPKRYAAPQEASRPVPVEA